MKLKFDNKYLKWGITAFLVFASCIMFYYLIFHGENIKAVFNKSYTLLMPILFGFVLGYLLTPVLNFIEEKILYPLAKLCKIKYSEGLKKWVRALGIIFTVTTFILIIYLLIIMLLSQIVPSIQSIIADSDEYVATISKWINQLLADNPQYKDSAINMINRYSVELNNFFNTHILSKSTEFIKTISLSVLSVLKVLWNFILGFVISIYLLGSKEKFANQSKKLIYAAFKTEKANVIINNFRFTHKTFIGFIGGKIVDSAIIGVLCFIGTSILQTPYAALVSIIVGVTNIIPFFGPFIGAIPSALLILLVDPLHPLNFVYFVIFVLLLQQLDGNFIGPMILGDSTGLSGFWVIFAITLFGGIWGVFGMIVGVPLLAVIYAAAKSFISMSLLKKNLPLNTTDYAKVESVDNDGVHEYEGRLLQHHKKAKAEEKYLSGRYFISSVDEWNYVHSTQFENSMLNMKKAEEEANKAQESKPKRKLLTKKNK